MRTVGVEEELLLVDARSDRPRAVGSQVLGIAAAHGDAGSDEMVGGKIEHELQEQQLETDTPPESDLAALEAALRSRRAKADAAAREAGARIVATGTSPFPVEPQLVHETRYERMAERFGLTATEQLACGCHVHVSVESDDEAIGVLDRIRVWLPTLLALSANSPFWQGTDTRYASFRWQTMIRWPISGPTDVFGTAENYRGRRGRPPRLRRPARRGHDLLPMPALRIATRPSRSGWPMSASMRETPYSSLRCVAGLWRPPLASGPPARLRRRRRPSCSGSPPGRPRGRESAATCSTRMSPGRGRRVRSSTSWSSTSARLCAAPGMSGSSSTGSRELFTRGTGARRQRAVMAKTGQLADVVADLVRATAGLE